MADEGGGGGAEIRGGGGGNWVAGARFSKFISRLSTSNRSRSATLLDAPIIREPLRSRQEQLSRHVGSIVVTHTGDGTQDAEGKDSIFVRKVSTASSRANIAGHLFGLTKPPPALETVIR